MIKEFVTSLEISKKLYGAGFKCESSFFLCRNTNEDGTHWEYKDIKTYVEDYAGGLWFHAYTLKELMQWIVTVYAEKERFPACPHLTYRPKTKDWILGDVTAEDPGGWGWDVYFCESSPTADTPQDAAGKFVLQMLEKEKEK